jgi:ADP-ribosylglycohydrolase
MTLFTAEGILRAETRGNRKGICDPASTVYYAYERWLHTQGYAKVPEYDWIYDGFLLQVNELYAQRAPGMTCLTSLSSRKQGTIETPINNSKGCGGIMRVVPAGLFYSKEKAFDLAAQFAAITHGHPSGYLSAGALAYLIASLIEGQDLESAAEDTAKVLKRYEGHEECTLKLKEALKLSRSNIADIDAIHQLGEGWVGEETLGISVYCALKHRNDFKRALIAAVNHNGDSDSTGAITGNILGAFLGMKGIPNTWVEKVELKEVILEIAGDLLVGYKDGEEWWERYPGY